MKDFIRVASYVKSYSLNVVISFLFNILYSIFSVFTLGMIVPFISILFGVIEPVNVKPVFDFSVNTLIDLMAYYISLISSHYSVLTAMMCVSALFLACALFSNLFRVLGLYFSNPIQVNTVKDIQNALDY
ncbi:MAG: hypothetical protein RBS13_05350, partial [Bacteroidales bacterium]|nr:hypothetical protein [Bacteroidales bacterium]